MHLCGLVTFFVILVSLTYQQVIEEPPKGDCRLWGDPHLLMFPAHPVQTDTRGIYWCQTPGRMLFLKNKYIEVNVNVTGTPYWNENFEVKLFAGSRTLCTITPQDFSCNDIFLKVKKIGQTMNIQYQEADFLDIIITSYRVNGHYAYDIHISQSYDLIRQSSGLCMNKQSACELENPANPFGKRRKRNLDLATATKVCNEYMKQAYITAKKTMGNTGSKMVEHARVACINDVSLSGDLSWGQSAIDFVTMDALKQAQLNAPQRLERLEIAVFDIAQAALLAEQNVHQFLSTDVQHHIIT